MRKIRTQEKETGIFVLVLALGSLCLVGNAFAQQEELDDQSVDDLIAIEQTQNPDISEPAIDILEPQIETLEPEFKTIEPVEGTGPSAPIYLEDKELNPDTQNITEPENFDNPETMENQ